MNKQIGLVNKKIIKLLGLDYAKEEPIFIGDANIKHMQEEPPLDFEKYGKDIENIISNTTYLARNEKKKSIEFIKKVSEDGTGSRSPSKDVGDVGVPPHLNFLWQKKKGY